MAPQTPTPAPEPKLAEVETIVHDIFLVGLAAAAFFVKNPNTAQRAGQVVSILEGLQVGTIPPVS